MTVQRRNAEMVDLLRADLQGRYEPQFALAQYMATVQALPGLRGFWPMSSFNESGNAYDLSGQGRALSYNGNPTYNWDGLAPYIDLDGTGDYLSRADEAGLDILGTESYVANPGLTVGGWFRFDRDTAAEALFAKSDGTTQTGRNFDMFFRGDTTDIVEFNLSNSTSGYQVTSGVLTTAQWYFIVARFVPSASLDLYINGTKTSNTTSIPASANNSTAPFQIGARNGANVPLDGRASLCFLCAAAHSDAIIGNLFQQSRALFGV